MTAVPKDAAHSRAASETARAAPPPLQNGDRLSRAEFERRYASMPHVKKAELIEGEVFMPSPVSLRHAEPHSNLHYALKTYALATPGTSCLLEATVRLDRSNEPQPDIHVRIVPECGGQSRTSDDFVEGAPELIAEIAASSVSIDLHRKKGAYQRNGVREYIVWRVDDGAIDWFALVDDEFRPRDPAADGTLRSEVFPGLRLDAAALLAADMPRVLAVVQEGLASEEHARFVAALAARARPEGSGAAPPAGA
jgi:Uma2 family endonuclease